MYIQYNGLVLRIYWWDKYRTDYCYTNNLLLRNRINEVACHVTQPKQCEKVGTGHDYLRTDCHRAILFVLFRGLTLTPVICLLCCTLATGVRTNYHTISVADLRDLHFITSSKQIMKSHSCLITTNQSKVTDNSRETDDSRKLHYTTLISYTNTTSTSYGHSPTHPFERVTI